MAPSILRKRRANNTTSTSTSQAQQGCLQPPTPLRHSLSLPDLTTPLLDPESWEELPSLSALPTKTSFSDASSPPSSASQANTTPRARKTSLIGHGSPVQFHRPFTPWQVVNNDTPSQLGSGADTSPPDGMDFRTSRARWGKDGMGTSSSVPGGLGLGKGWKKRAKSKAMSRLNVVVVGPKGVGKSSLIQLFIDSLEHEVGNRSSTGSSSTPSSPTVPGPPVPITTLGPTTRMSARTINVSDAGFERTSFRLIDTPGIAMGDDLVEAKERERGLAGLVMMMEEKFGEVMREESRIIRRATRGEDDLIHLVLYLIDSRFVLHPPAPPQTVDWSCVGVFDEKDLGPSKSKPSTMALPADGIETIRRLSLRANVLPVLAHIDSLSTLELDQVRQAVRRDLSSLDGGGFGIFSEAEEEEEQSKTPTTDALDSTSADIACGPRPPTPASTVDSTQSAAHPLAIFNPERSEGERFSRGFAWGSADVLDPGQSDFLALRDAILGTHAKALRMTTREVLYERYRTEKLTEKQKAKSQQGVV